MKKMLTIAAVAFCVAAVQAAQVSWNVEDVTAKSGSKLSDSGIAYMFDAAKYSADDIAGAIADGTFGDLTHMGKVATIDEEEPGYLSAGKYDDSNVSANTQYTVFAVVFDGNDTSSGNYLITGNKTFTTKGSGSTSVALGSQANNKNWQPVGVPEPCSVALFALGLAAFGLKRKVA